MWFDVATTDRVCRPPAVELISVYNVKADESYVIGPLHEERSRLLLFRTHDGRGRITFEDGHRITHRRDSLTIARWHRIAQYLCVGPQWDFWGIVLTCKGDLWLPTDTHLQVPGSVAECAEWHVIFDLLKSREPVERALASTQLAALICRWATVTQAEVAVPKLHEDTVNEAVDLMSRELGGRLQVADIARAVGLSPRRLQQVFVAHTGKSPKAYYDDLRIRRSKDLLLMTNWSVARIAEELGYSSPFHFSRAFKRNTGQTARHYRTAASLSSGVG